MIYKARTLEEIVKEHNLVEIENTGKCPQYKTYKQGDDIVYILLDGDRTSLYKFKKGVCDDE